MTRRILLITALLSLIPLLSQCSETVYEDEIPFSLENVSVKSIGPSHKIDGIFLGRPNAVEYLSSGKLLISESRSAQLLMLMDPTTGDVVRFLNNGRGPQECQHVSNMAVAGHELYVYSQDRNSIFVYGLQTDGAPVFDRDIHITQDNFRVIPAPGKGYLGIPYYEGRFFLYDENGMVTDTLGTFPHLEGDSKAKNNTAAQSMIAYSPDGKHFCSSYLSMDCIEIYPSDFSSVKRLLGPEPFSPTVKEVNLPGGVTYVMTPAKSVYSTISTSNRGFIVGYKGQFDKRGEPPAAIRKLIYFDWKGNAVAQYDLPEDIVTFDINWEQGKLYAITAGLERTLTVADIDLD